MKNTNWVRESIEAVRKAADRGCAEAQYELGKRLLTGRDGAPDFEEGFSWCDRAARRGLVKALNTVGYCHAMGRGTVRSNRRAFDAFLKAMLLGDMVATYNLAFCFEQGIGIKADRAIAEMLYRKSSKMGYAKARGVHACILYNNAQASIERESALRWFEKAAAHGDEVARANLKRCRRGKKPVPHTGRDDSRPDAATCLEGAA